MRAAIERMRFSLETRLDLVADRADGKLADHVCNAHVGNRSNDSRAFKALGREVLNGCRRVEAVQAKCAGSRKSNEPEVAVFENRLVVIGFAGLIHLGEFLSCRNCGTRLDAVGILTLV